MYISVPCGKLLVQLKLILTLRGIISISTSNKLVHLQVNVQFIKVSKKYLDAF